MPKQETDVNAFQQLTSAVAEFVLNDQQQGRALIHCRAGWGRSGTLLTIISQIYMLSKHTANALSIKDTLVHLRILNWLWIID